MVTGVKKAVIALVLVMLAIPALAEARTVHNFGCGQCHKSGVSFYELGGNNICLSCHSAATRQSMPLGAGYNAAPVALFVGEDASDAIGSHPISDPSGPGTETSHMWATSTDYKPEAGAQPPTTYASQFNGYYGISRGKLTCSRCHNPHGKNDLDTKLLKVPNDSDQMCTDCHLPWNVANSNASLTHPVGINYNAFSGDTLRFKGAIDNSGTAYGDVRLVGGKVSCSSCHAPHFADSDGTTKIGKEQTDPLNPLYNGGLNEGDGKLLRTDGTLVTGANQNETGQRRSSLCTACHIYKPHGKPATKGGDDQIGCLDCHGGHSFDATTPNIFVLKKKTSTVAPRYGHTYTSGSFTYNTATFGSYTTPYNAATTPNLWSDRTAPVGTISGYCEECHGDVQSPPIVDDVIFHKQGETKPCGDCHFHNAGGWDYSFQPDASAASCGQCHGFPPWKDVRGDRVEDGGGGVDGGYAYDKDDLVTPYWNYKDHGDYKRENATAHRSHAGGTVTGYNSIYYNLATGTANCNVCHGENAGYNTNHKDVGRASSFRDVPFNAFATHYNALAPSYKTTTGGQGSQWSCTNVYCHSNGGPRNASGTRIFNTGFWTPTWTGPVDGGTGGLDHYIGAADQNWRCQQCHGNDSTSMGTKGNTAAHGAHLAAPYNFNCNRCHASTALTSSSLVPGTTYVRGSGTHADGSVEVIYNSDTMNGELASGTYNSTSAVCSVYCHNPSGSGVTADWDSTTAMQCDSCHGGLASDTSADGGAGPIATGVHARHVYNSVGPQFTCDQCHGSGAISGSQNGHLDGLYTLDYDPTGGDCNTCHAVDLGEGETAPNWYNSATFDCKTCHTGTTTSSFNNGAVRTAPEKKAAINFGHSKAGVGRDCVDCHNKDATSHFNGLGTALADHRLNPSPVTSKIYNSANPEPFCTDCHDATPEHSHYANSRSAGTTNTSDDGNQCNICHDPHGQYDVNANGQDAMITATIGGKNVINFYNSALRDSFYSTGADLSGGKYGICQVCHDPTDSDNINYFNRVTESGTTHNNTPAGKLCTDCHKHTDDPSFGASACNGCHGGGNNTVPTGNNWPDSDPTNTRDDALDIIDRAGAHGPHMNAIGLGNTSCDYCHPGIPPADHLDEVAPANLIKADILSSNDGTPDQDLGFSYKNLQGGSDANGWYSETNQTCSDVACHGGPGSVSPNWYSGSATCTTCHNSGVNDGNLYNSVPLATSVIHDRHVKDAATAYVNDCDSCHGAGANTGTQTGHMNQAVNIGSPLTGYNATNLTCANTCHLAANNDWAGAATLNCIDCHSGSYLGEAQKPRTTGLHVSYNTVTHDESFGSGGTCTSCHTSLTVASPASHSDGFNTDPVGTFGLFTSYNSTNSSCSGAGVGGSCHTDGGDWKRKWNAAIDQSPDGHNPGDTVCGNCHGDWANGWNWNGTTTGVQHNDPYPQPGNAGNNFGDYLGWASGQHADCQACHGWGNANYNSVWLGSSDINYKGHGDGYITMNGPDGPTPVGAGYNSTTGGCAKACHLSSFTMNTTSGWTENYGDFGAGSCNGCHGGSNGQYWPDGTSSPTSYEDDNANSAARHNTHVEAIAKYKWNYNIALLLADGGTDAKQKLICEFCHGTNPGAGGHSTDSSTGGSPVGRVDLAAAANFKKFTGSAADAVDSGSGAYNFTNKNCSNLVCHNLVATPTAAADNWEGTTGPNCTTFCHDPEDNTPSREGHVEHRGTKSYNCTECHVDNGTNYRHLNGVVNINFTNAGSMEQTYGSATTASYNHATLGEVAFRTGTYGTCANVYCHVDKTTPAWNGTITNSQCMACHSTDGSTNNPTTGLHRTSQALAHDDNFGAAGYDCVRCHASSSPSNSHQDGNLDAYSGPVYNWNSVTLTDYTVYNASITNCSATCHSDGGDWNRRWKGVADAVPQATDDPATANVCANCHGTFAKGWNGVTTSHVDPDPDNSGDGMSNHSDCQTCHGWGNANYNAVWLGSSSATYIGHGDGYITMNGPVGTGTGYNNATGGCDTSNCHGAYDLTMTTNNSWDGYINYGDFGSAGAGGCAGCHGYPPVKKGRAVGAGNYADGADEKYMGGGRVHTITAHLDPNVVASEGWANCDKCHKQSVTTHSTGWNWARTQSSTYPEVILNTAVVGAGASFTKGAVDSVDGMGYCSNVNCHFTESPKEDCKPDKQNDGVTPW